MIILQINYIIIFINNNAVIINNNNGRLQDLISPFNIPLDKRKYFLILARPHQNVSPVLL
jgi:hypothetical protein